MIIIVLGFLLILAYIYNRKNFIFLLMLFFVFFDMVDGFYKDNNIFAAVRYVIPLILITMFTLSHDVVKKSDIVFLLLSIFLCGLLIFNSGDIIISTKTVLSIVISVSMVLVGRYLGTRIDFVRSFKPYNRVLLIVVPVYVLYANIFNVGQSYSNSFTTGFFETSRMYLVPIVVFMAIHYVLSDRRETTFWKIVDTTFIGINLIILVLTTRRTSLIMLLGAMIIYMLMNREIIFKMAVILFFLVSALVVTYPLYESILNAQLEERERITRFDTYQNEGRYLETFFIINYHKRVQDPQQFFFGIQLFDSMEFGTRHFGYPRAIHSDLNMIFFSTGLVGSIVFLGFFVHYLLVGNSSMISENTRLFYPILMMFLIVLIPGRFIGTFTFAPLMMLLLGGIKYNNKLYSNRRKKRREIGYSRVLSN